MNLKYLKIISNLSFIFLLVNFSLCTASYAAVSIFIFLWLILASIILYSEKYVNMYNKIILEVVLMLPVFFIEDNREKIIIFIIFGVIIYLYKRNKNKLSYGETADEFKKGFLLLLIIVIISGVSFNSINTDKNIIPYAIIYLTFTVMLIRYLRNYEHNAVNKKLNKINLLYFICTIISALILALKSVRQFISSALVFIYTGIMSIFINIFSLIILLISNLFKNVHLKGINPNIKIDIQNNKLINPNNPEMGLAASNPLLYRIIVIIINALLIMLVIYIIIKVLNKKAGSEHKTDKFIETKEFIFAEKHSNKFKKLFNFGDYSSQIKYYYKKLMKDCIAKGINLKKSNTTLDIYLKSKEVFDENSLWNMRDLYIETRYGSTPSTRDKVKEIRRLYKNK